MTEAEGQEQVLEHQSSSPAAARTGRDWVFVGTAAVNPTVPTVDEVHPGPTVASHQPDGSPARPLRSRLSSTGLVRSAWSVQSATDHLSATGLVATEVVYLGPGPMRLRIIEQKLGWPIDLRSVTGGSPSDEVHDLPSGERVVVVKRLLPSAIQVVVVNDDGLMVNAMAEWISTGSPPDGGTRGTTRTPTGPPLEPATLIDLARALAKVPG